MTNEAHPDTVLIIDFGSQVTQLIARRVREAGVYSEIVPFQLAEDAFHRIGPKAVILSGSPASTIDIGSPRAPQIVFEAGIPVLGICYGEQTMCAQLGGKVEGGHHREFGRAFLDIEDECALFAGVFGWYGAEFGRAAAGAPHARRTKPLAPSTVWPSDLHVESISPSAPVPPTFVCPITMAPMANPAITPRGTTYDREALCDWITKHHRYPGGEARAVTEQTQACDRRAQP